MGDNLMEKVNAFGERLKIGGAEVGRKMSASMTSVSFKMKELFNVQNQAEKIVESATSENNEEPDWAANLDICDMMNSEKVNSVELIRGIKKRIMLKNPRIQYLALILLETCVKNCEKAFSEVAAERVLDEMVKLIDDPQTIPNNRSKALMMIEAWGESVDELRYLPVYEETYKSLKSRGIRFPGRDDESLAPIFTPSRSTFESEARNEGQPQVQDVFSPLTITAEESKEALNVARNSVELLSSILTSSTKQDVLKDDLVTTLVQQCFESQSAIQRMIQTSDDNEAMLFEALSINDDLQQSLSKYEELKKPPAAAFESSRAMIPVAVEQDESPSGSGEVALVRKQTAHRGTGEDHLLDDLDEMIFGRKASQSENHNAKKEHQKDGDDLISF